MLTLYTADGGIPLRVDDYYIRELASGYDELVFSISIWDEDYPKIQEEATIIEAGQAYLVKAIDGGKDTATIKAQIDLDDWRGALTLDFNSGSKTAANIVRSVAPLGWAVVDASMLTNKRTVTLTGATPLDVLEALRSPWPSLTYRFDTAAKTITLVNMALGQNLGAYATRDLNLVENDYKGKSSGFITRLYAYGKDGLSFASVNAGKAYVDNNDYSARVICGCWIDERYTVPENLLADAQERLAEMAKPARSYTCSVIDLAAINPAYGFLDFSLFSVVSLIDHTRGRASVEHRVVERWRYPHYPQKNKVTLSTVPAKIQSQVQQAINNFNNQNSVWAQQQRTAQQNAIANATAQITGANGGNMRAIYDSSGNWSELVVMNTDSILTASKVWRFNLGGLGYSPNGYNGPYTTAITMDGAIVADFITTGTLDAALANIINLNASNITTGTLSADRISVSDLSAFNATVGGWSIDTSRLEKEVTGSYRVRISAPASPGGTNVALSVQDWYNNAWRWMWYVRYDGFMYARNAQIEGNITATSGVIGGVTISNGKLTGIKDENILAGGISGGSGGSLASASITDWNTSTGINTNLGYGAAFGLASASATAIGLDHFNAGGIRARSSLRSDGALIVYGLSSFSGDVSILGNSNRFIYRGKTASWQQLTIGGTSYYVLVGS